MTGLVEMRRFGYPVVFDATHSVQSRCGQELLPVETGNDTRTYYGAALAVGVDAIFTEVHPDPIMLFQTDRIKSA